MPKYSLYCYTDQNFRMNLNVTSAIENVHLFSLKKMLQVPILTPNVMVYEDSGMYELRIPAVLRSIKYWIRILDMENSRNVCKVCIT